MKTTLIRGGLWVLLGLAYLFISVYGFLSGMFSESLIGIAYPWADALANVVVWFGVGVGVSPVICAAAASALSEKLVARRIVLALPFIVLMIQLGLSYIANTL